MIVLGISLTACMQSALLHHVPTRNACIRTLLPFHPPTQTFKPDFACLLVISLRRIDVSVGFGCISPLANQTSYIIVYDTVNKFPQLFLTLTAPPNSFYFFFLAAVAVAGLADALMGPTGKVLPKKALPE